MKIRQKKDLNSTQSLFNISQKNDNHSPFTSEFSQFSPPPKKQSKSSLAKTRAQLQMLQEQRCFNFGDMAISRPVTDVPDLQQKIDPEITNNSSGENNQGIRQNLAALIVQRNRSSSSFNHLQGSGAKSLPRKVNLQRHTSSGQNSMIQRDLMSLYDFNTDKQGKNIERKSNSTFNKIAEELWKYQHKMGELGQQRKLKLDVDDDINEIYVPRESEDLLNILGILEELEGLIVIWQSRHKNDRFSSTKRKNKKARVNKLEKQVDQEIKLIQNALNEGEEQSSGIKVKLKAGTPFRSGQLSRRKRKEKSEPSHPEKNKQRNDSIADDLDRIENDLQEKKKSNGFSYLDHDTLVTIVTILKNQKHKHKPVYLKDKDINEILWLARDEKGNNMWIIPRSIFTPDPKLNHDPDKVSSDRMTNKSTNTVPTKSGGGSGDVANSSWALKLAGFFS